MWECNVPKLSERGGERDIEAIEYSYKIERLLFGMDRGLSRAGPLYLMCGRLHKGQKHIHGKHRYSRKFADCR
jgi:hypothetical protein